MNPTDLRVLWAALGFTAVVMQGGRLPKAEGAKRAQAFAKLIEEFCRISVPEAFEEREEPDMRVIDPEISNPEEKFSLVERMATAIAEIMREQGGCLPLDLVAKGFTRDEIDRHWPMAKALAYVELKIMDS
jgi:hypothetical protein